MLPFGPGHRERQKLRPGTWVQLWPGDACAKYGVVRRADRRTVTIEITRVDPGETYYRPGDVVVLPRDRLVVVSGKPSGK